VQVKAEAVVSGGKTFRYYCCSTLQSVEKLGNAPSSGGIASAAIDAKEMEIRKG
jgi:hypothetical protein